MDMVSKIPYDAVLVIVAVSLPGSSAVAGDLALIDVRLL
jgi:hypothetical protein